jgi:hypothetical protein
MDFSAKAVCKRGSEHQGLQVQCEVSQSGTRLAGGCAQSAWSTSSAPSSESVHSHRTAVERRRERLALRPQTDGDEVGRALAHEAGTLAVCATASGHRHARREPHGLPRCREAAPLTLNANTLPGGIRTWRLSVETRRRAVLARTTINISVRNGLKSWRAISPHGVWCRGAGAVSCPMGERPARNCDSSDLRLREH